MPIYLPDRGTIHPQIRQAALHCSPQLQHIVRLAPRSVLSLALVPMQGPTLLVTLRRPLPKKVAFYETPLKASRPVGDLVISCASRVGLGIALAHRRLTLGSVNTKC